MTRKLALLALAASLTACGIPKEKYYAARDAEDEARKAADAASARAAALEKQLQELKGKQSQLERSRSSALAEAEAQRAEAGRLQKSKEELEAEKAAAAAEAERQRLIAAELEKQAKALAAEKASATDEAERQRQLAERLAAEKAELEKKSADYLSLMSSLSDEIKAGRVQVHELQGKLSVRMAEKVLFPTGSATISREGQSTLKAVAAGLQAVKGRIIRVEGHTDNVPIRNERFPSNWELSAGRAIAVVRFFQAQGIEPARLGAAGYAEFQPIAPNDSAEGRAQNRRIEISLALPPSALPEAAAK